MTQSESILVVALEGRVIGIDIQTGQEQWRNEMHCGGIRHVALCVTSDRVYASASAKRFFCIDRQSGETIWERMTQGMGRATILVSPETIVVYKRGFVEAFDLNGDVRWTTKLKNAGKGAAALGLGNNVTQADG
jgi:hypothetical protein